MSRCWSNELFGLDLGALPLVDSTVDGARLLATATVAQHGATVEHLGTTTVPSAGFAAALAAAATTATEGPASLAAVVALAAEHREYGPNALAVDTGAVTVVDVGGTDGLAYPFEVAGGSSSGPATAHVVETIPEATVRPQPGRMAVGISAPAGPSYIWSVEHWVDLLVLNLLTLQYETSVLGGLGTGNEIDETAVVHQTAVVEGSRVGAGATIGPNAVVRNSTIEPGCEIAELTSIAGSHIGAGSVVQTGALVAGSVIGDETVVSFQTAIRGSVLLGRSTISAPVVARSVIGPEVFLARGVSIGATSLTDSTIAVRPSRRSIDTGMHLLGCAVGRGARIGNGIDLPAGYEVPAEAYLASQPPPRIEDDVARKTPLLLIGRRFRPIGFGRAGSDLSDGDRPDSDPTGNDGPGGDDNATEQATTRHPNDQEDLR